METKICSQCKEPRPISEFGRHPTSGTQPYCLKCQRARSKEWYSNNKERQGANVRRNRLLFVNAFKSWKRTLSCSCCPESTPICIDFHHKDSETKEHNINDIKATVSWTGMVRELNKCIAVCSNCHRKIHDGLLNVEHIPLIQMTVEQFKEYAPEAE